MQDLVVSIGWALAGGALIGISASLLLALNGKVAGISGIASGLLSPTRGEVAWRALFVAGLLAGGAAAYVVMPEAFDASAAPALALVALAGLLVGVGTRLGNGCTSGHGVCGISRIAPRSIAATLTFMLTGALTVVLVRALGGMQ
ncbi:MAG: YeeE/YedE family protein [Myxococcota bacterium]|nr:YeeE/YedE family protein [Myxococcota bacterium]